MDIFDEEAVSCRVKRMEGILKGEDKGSCFLEKGGKVIELRRSHHAVIRFKERIGRIYGMLLKEQECQRLIRHYFNSSKEELDQKGFFKRNRKYTLDTTYFRSGNFRFVVSGVTIVTFELCGAVKRYNHGYKDRRFTHGGLK